MGWCVTIKEACLPIASSADSGVTVKQVMTRAQAADRSPSKEPNVIPICCQAKGSEGFQERQLGRRSLA